jgi:hypothetical protein
MNIDQEELDRIRNIIEGEIMAAYKAGFLAAEKLLLPGSDDFSKSNAKAFKVSMLPPTEAEAAAIAKFQQEKRDQASNEPD